MKEATEEAFENSDTALLIETPAKHAVFINNVEPHRMIMKITAAVFYAVASFFITVINKSILTGYAFPSFQILALGQVVATVVFLYAAKWLGRIKFPDFHWRIFSVIFPLPLIYIANLIFGLGSTKELSLPMFTMLRRLSIFMTMIGEYSILGIIPSGKVQVSVFLIIFGAVIAALEDLAFNFQGYFYVLLNDFFTASSNVVTKQKLDSRLDLGKYGLMFYSAVFVLPGFVLVTYLNGELEKAVEFQNWSSISFIIQFFMSCFMGFVLIYSVMLCTEFNSALTTTIIGCLKNILITYLGMIIGGDYVYSLENFIGINISVIGSLLYSWVTFKPLKSSSLSKSKSTSNA